MGIKERRERQKKATRDSILNAALRIAKTEGWAAVTVRHVAELIEYSPPIIYEHFANKGALLEELQGQGFTLLAAKVREASAGEENVRERLLQISDAYVCFAYEQPEFYQIMNDWNSAEIPLDKTLSQASYLGDIVQDCLETWAATQKVFLPDPAASVEIAWGLLHGLVSVEKLGRLGGGKDRVRQLARQGVDDLFTAWSAN